jgi:putative membrane protein insertion efficiency factor
MNLESKLTKVLNIPKEIELQLIRGYQRTLSLDHGTLGKIYPNHRVCKFTPTCSEYGYEVVDRYGIFKGNYLAIKRIFKCNPWAIPGQYDPVPEK